jgi:ABC-type transporter Mla subunit MlaD
MTSEEVERAIKFLLDSQAQLIANVGSLSDTVGNLSGTVGKLSGTVDKLSEKIDRTADNVIALLAIAEIHEQEINSLKEASRATDEKLVESSRATDERLNALILMVERYISRRDGNGGAPPGEK